VYWKISNFLRRHILSLYANYLLSDERLLPIGMINSLPPLIQVTKLATNSIKLVPRAIYNATIRISCRSLQNRANKALDR